MCNICDCKELLLSVEREKKHNFYRIDKNVQEHKRKTSHNEHIMTHFSLPFFSKYCLKLLLFIIQRSLIFIRNIQRVSVAEKVIIFWKCKKRRRTSWTVSTERATVLRERSDQITGRVQTVPAWSRRAVAELEMKRGGEKCSFFESAKQLVQTPVLKEA